MRIAIFAHSFRSCWNHGNAHFLRGVARALVAGGHDARLYEPADGWSATHLRADHGQAALDRFDLDFPTLRSRPFAPDADIEALLDGADLVLVHEWNDPALVARIGATPRHGVLLFHDTHHRAISDPGSMRALNLSGYDGVLAFGEALAEVYRGWGWGRRVFAWHEAADAALFRPPARECQRTALAWIGNWGDDERADELDSFLFGPATDEGLPLDVFGVRYPEHALALLASRGARYQGWIANADVPGVFARHLATVHVPRRFYERALPGIPTIRVFEALACGIPLLCAPWDDAENLFRPGSDYLVARDGAAMRRHMRDVTNDPALRAELSARGLETIRARHTCAHRAAELLRIAARLGGGVVPAEAAA